MVPARRLPVDRVEPEGAAASASQSGIRLRESSAVHALVGVRIPPHDPLPRIDYDEDEDALEERSRKFEFANALPTVTSVSGVPIAIAPSAASVSVLSSSPPREASRPPAPNVLDERHDEAATDASLHYALAFVALSAIAMALATVVLD